MPRYESYRSNAAEAPIMRKWVIRALLLSLLLHGGLFVFFKYKQLDQFAASAVERLAPPRFVVKKVTISDRALKEPEDLRLKVKEKISNATIAVPQEKPEPKEIQLSPKNIEISSPILNDKPVAKPLNWDMSKLQAESSGRADSELSSLATTLLKDSVRSANQRVIKLPNPTKDGEGIGGNEGIPGRQTIDEALEQFGSPGATATPIGMPGGALFDHDSSELAPKSIDDLQKLGQLFKRYPDANFIISGHTDHTGTFEYNRGLSEMRAIAVKEWLVKNMGIDPARIQTVGKANSEPIEGLGPDKSIEDQAPNRRVEIVIKTRRK